jgi:hypothetical protein
MFQIAMVILIRLGMHDDGIDHSRAIHAFQQVLGRRRFVRPVGGPLVIGKPRVIFAGEAMQMSIDQNRFFVCGVRGRGPEVSCQWRCSGSDQELSAINLA